MKKKKGGLFRILLLLVILLLVYAFGRRDGGAAVSKRTEPARPTVTAAPVREPESEAESEEMPEAESKEESAEEKTPVRSGIRPEFKAAMDSYEAFYDEYIALMKKYSANPTDLSLLTQYMDLLSKTEEMDKSFEQWDEDDMSDEELKYYLEVNLRVSQKLIHIA